MPAHLMTQPPDTASTVTLIGIPGFCPSGASVTQAGQGRAGTGQQAMGRDRGRAVNQLVH